MKKTVLLFIFFFGMHQLFAQNNSKTDGSYFKQCSSFEISKPFRELAEMSPATNKPGDKLKESHDKKGRGLIPQNKQHPSATPLEEDPIQQKTEGFMPLATPLVNFDGQPGDASPADPSGAAGPNHYVQAVNDQFRVYDKTGKPLINSLDLKTLWTGSINEGDPIVLYDKFADRWFIQQFQQSGNKILIAISTTPDPTGTYYQYTFVPDASQFPDYPKFSIWSDGYYQTSNFNTQKIAVYDRAKMLVGDKTAGMIVTNLPSTASEPLPGNGFFSPLTLDADGELPPNGTPNYIMFYEDDNQKGPKDEIVIYKMTTDWTNKKATIALDITLPVQAFNSYFTGGTFKDIAQPSGAQKLDALDGFFAYRAPYRVWTGYNSVVLCNTVNLGNLIAGIRWYELRQDNSTKVWSIYQQGTYGPSDGVSRWTPSIAMDDKGSIGLAYAVSSSTSVFPGIRYTGRLSTSPLGTMDFAEQVAKAGTSTLTNTGNRWGDYSQTSLDPDGITFWHTNQYSGGGQKTRIFSFRISPLTGIETIKNEISCTVFQAENQLNVKVNNLPSNESTTVDLFDISGKQMTGTVVNPSGNAFETSFNVATLAKGIYLVRIGNHNFQKVIKATVN
jgi:hypothetical protein